MQNKLAMSLDSSSNAHARMVRSLVRGELQFHQLPKDLPAREAAEIRRLALEQLTRAPLANIGRYSLDTEYAAHYNCENFFGVAQIPMGVVGPLSVHGQYMDEEVYIPLATTEGALVASTNRGCAALREASGAVVRAEDVGMTLAPVFRTSGTVQTQEFLQWIDDHQEDLRRVIASSSRHLKLLEVRPYAFGTTVFLRFRFSTGDAMGMNMVTVACDRLVDELIEPATGVPCIGLSGNYCVDRKPAQINFQEGCGKRIYAEVLFNGPVLRHVLKTDAHSLVEAQYRKNLLGSIAVGSLGFNAHYANVLAGFFLATGQDPAHVAKLSHMSSNSSLAEFYAEFQQWPKPVYPWPDFIHPDYLQEREEYYAWIDRDYLFQGAAAREKHKRHNLTDIAARGLPFLKSLAELRPIANYAANGAMMDDYFDRCSRREMLDLVKRIEAILLGELSQEPEDDGFLRQWWVLRQDALSCRIPEHIYRSFVASIIHAFSGYAEEKRYYEADVTPPLEVYTIIREATSGGLPFGRYVCLQKDYRQLPDEVLNHPHILRMHVTCAMMIGMHNDFVSLPKELYRSGDTLNIVKVLQQQHQLSLKEAYLMAIEHHDKYLDEFLLLEQHLPLFDSRWREMVRQYTEDLGVMVSGVYAWHTHDLARYVPNGYVEGEFVRKACPSLEPEGSQGSSSGAKFR